jgi:hypothetical protein
VSLFLDWTVYVLPLRCGCASLEFIFIP